MKIVIAISEKQFSFFCIDFRQNLNLDLNKTCPMYLTEHWAVQHCYFQD